MADRDHPYGTIDVDFAARLANYPVADGPVYMLNLMKYHEVAQYEDGTDQVSGREADDRYAPVEILADLGAQVTLFGDVVASSEDWDRVAVVRYPTRRSFIAMQSRPDFAEKHRHKRAGMHHTTIVALAPPEEPPVDGRGRVLVELWSGDAPRNDAVATDFRAEGTIVGDGRRWDGARVGRLEVPVSLALDRGEAHRLLVEVEATISQWT